MTHSILIIAVSALTTMAIRFFPFLAFGKRKVPEIVQYLGQVLPCHYGNIGGVLFKRSDIILG